MSDIDELLKKAAESGAADEEVPTDLSAEMLAKYDPEKLARIFVAKAGKGTRLEHGQKEKFERALRGRGQGGADFGKVRLFTGELADEMTRAHRADALTIANTGIVLLRSSRFDPYSMEGERILAHELTHVAQAQETGLHARGAGGELGGSESEREAHEAEDHVGGGEDGESRHEREAKEKELRHRVLARVLELLDGSQVTSWERLGYTRDPFFKAWKRL